jgi:AcrR family transcriptional regulator
MKAKSDLLSTARQQAAPAKGKKPARRVTVRMPTADRRAQVLAKAYEFFSEYGLTAQTRALAEACGVSQRLLYSLFLNKSELITAVYETEIAGPFKAVWFVQLTDRSTPMEQRLNAFYRDYYDTILTRRWLRLFLYSSLAEVDMAPTFIAQIVTHLMETIVKEAAQEAGLTAPDNAAQCQEIGWILHGTVSHLAIRRHLYGGGSSLPVEQVLQMHVKSFLSGLPALLAKGSAGA